MLSRQTVSSDLHFEMITKNGSLKLSIHVKNLVNTADLLSYSYIILSKFKFTSDMKKKGLVRSELMEFWSTLSSQWLFGFEV